MMMKTIGLPLLLALAAAAGPAVDREPAADEWGYRPADGAPVPLNPPSLTWVQEPKALRYEVQWASREDFSDAAGAETRWCVYTHSEPLKPGPCFWRYRDLYKEGPSPWSRIRRFTVPPDAVPFPKPTLEELRRRVPKDHPRLFLRPEDLPKLREWIRGDGRETFGKLRKAADQIVAGELTPEPTVRGSNRDPKTRSHWWSNRVQTQKACQEAEIVTLTWRLTNDKRYAEAARRTVLHLASWDPDGPTNFALNCEAAKPMVYRLPRAYDWGYDALTEEDRAKVRSVMKRRALDAWKSGEAREGIGHLNRPYNSHGNRIWHKLAECALATLGEIPEAETWLDYAVNKFFAAYPVWSDDDGGWHEGLSYWGGYMSKVICWTDAAEKALGIESFKKPFFSHAADYALYTAPPGSPDMGFGDLSFRPPSSSWSFVREFAQRAGNGRWAWWADRWKMEEESGEPALRVLWGARPRVEPKAPMDLPPSRVFRGTGVAVLNATLLDAAENVQLRLKSSPMGRQSHGHDPHNSFTLNAYGEILLTNCVYRDIHGSPFHTKWCWSTKAQNALLVDGEGQKTHSPDPMGRIEAWDFQEGADYVRGEAAAAYPGKLKRFARHVVHVKPDLVVVADEIEAEKPATFQWMLHGLGEFRLDEAAQELSLERDKAGVRIRTAAPEPLKFRQWTGFEPPPDQEYLDSIKRAGFPPQYHVEASTAAPRDSIFALTVIRPYRKGQNPEGPVEVTQEAVSVTVKAGGVEVAIRKPGAPFAIVRKGGREWRLGK
jgi:hypothetical protein